MATGYDNGLQHVFNRIRVDDLMVGVVHGLQDETMKLSERRAALKDYGFVCNCPRCRSDEAKRASKKAKKKAAK